MRLNQLDGLLAFWKVAEHRGFTAAAAELEVSPSALSQAIRHLEARLGVRLLSMHTVKPLDKDAVTRAATETRYVFTLEEHSVEGGLGGAVAEVMAELEPGSAPLRRIGLRPEFNKTVGDQNYLKAMHGLDEESVLKTIQQIITRSYGRVG